jgi:hypothetical protein
MGAAFRTSALAALHSLGFTLRCSIAQRSSLEGRGETNAKPGSKRLRDTVASDRRNGGALAADGCLTS